MRCQCAELDSCALVATPSYHFLVQWLGAFCRFVCSLWMAVDRFFLCLSSCDSLLWWLLVALVRMSKYILSVIPVMRRVAVVLGLSLLSRTISRNDAPAKSSPRSAHEGRHSRSAFRITPSGSRRTFYEYTAVGHGSYTGLIFPCTSIFLIFQFSLLGFGVLFYLS